MKPKIGGTITALVCPFNNGEIDYPSLERLLQSQLSQGVAGFVIHGTTGESPTLSRQEKKEIFSFIKKRVPAEFPLIVGTGTNSTAESIENSLEAERWGATALLLVVPYYNKPPQRGLYAHFKAVASAVKIPSLLYNVPGRTVAKLELETIQQLSREHQIIGIKEASGDIHFAKAIREACPKDFILLSGDDGTYDEFMSVGGDGVISVASHLIPKAFQTQTAKQHKELIDFLFVEANPIPVKYALHRMGLLSSAECRLPLVDLDPQYRDSLVGLMQRSGVL